jgi:hypothetical protein
MFRTVNSANFTVRIQVKVVCYQATAGLEIVFGNNKNSYISRLNIRQILGKRLVIILQGLYYCQQLFMPKQTTLHEEDKLKLWIRKIFSIAFSPSVSRYYADGSYPQLYDSLTCQRAFLQSKN